MLILTEDQALQLFYGTVSSRDVEAYHIGEHRHSISIQQRILWDEGCQMTLEGRFGRH